MSTLDNLKYKYKQLNVLDRLIAVNAIIFIAALLFKPLFGFVFNWFELPSSLGSYIVKPWTIITYAFLHYDFIHILFNMLWLYVIGRLFLNLFSPKLALNVYFLGAIVGGLLFMLGYNIFPNFFVTGNRLVGASAAVRALFIFVCAYMPQREVRFFTFNIKLMHIGIAMIVFDVIGLFGGNQGGNLAHLGGAALGYYYATQLTQGRDIGKGFEKLMDTVMGWFNGSKSSNLKTVYKRKSKVGGYTKEEFSEFNNQKRIDVILDKISKSGYDSLTAEERDFLFRQGNK